MGHSESGSGGRGRVIRLCDGDKDLRVSPDIYPPFKGVTTRHYLWWVYGQNRPFGLGFVFGRETEIKPDCNQVPEWGLR